MLDKILEEREKSYGDFGVFTVRMRSLLNTLKRAAQPDLPMDTDLITEKDIHNFFIVLKLLRFQTDTGIDTIIDLEGYARLIKDDVHQKVEANF